MAHLTAAETTADPCCAPAAQASCCEPSAKADCCGHEEGCGCAAGSEPTKPTDVRERYAAAVQVTSTHPGAGCCAPSETFDGGSELFGAALDALRAKRPTGHLPSELVAMLDAVRDLRPALNVLPPTKATASRDGRKLTT